MGVDFSSSLVSQISRSVRLIITRSLVKERIHTSQLVCTCPHNLEIRWH